MKILQVVSGREINGALVYCQLLTRRLLEAGHEPIVVCRRGSWLTRQGLPVPIIESDLERYPFDDLKEIRSLVEREKVDVIHTHMSRAHTFGILLKGLTGVPVVATAHNRYVQLHWRFNDFVIANSLATERYHRRWNLVRADRSRTIHCFVDSQRFTGVGEPERRKIRRELRYNGNEFVVGVVGEVIPRKGQLYLAQALPELMRRIPELRVLLVGRYHRSERYVQKMRQLQARTGLYKMLRWLGRRSNVQEYMAAMDLVLVTSTEEPFGLVAVESQLAGKPTVATNVGGLPEIVQHERNGLLIPPRSPGAIVEAIDRLYRDRELARQLAASGQAEAAGRFDPQRLTGEVIGVYREVLRRRGRLADRSGDEPGTVAPANDAVAIPNSPEQRRAA